VDHAVVVRDGVECAPAGSRLLHVRVDGVEGGGVVVEGLVEHSISRIRWGRSPNKNLGKVEFVAVPIGHAGTTLVKTKESLASALSAKRPSVQQARAIIRIVDHTTDGNAKTHGYNVVEL